MKNKFNFLVKLICTISILISILIFIVFIANLESTKVKLASIKGNDIKTEFQEDNVKPGKIKTPEVVLETSDNEEQSEDDGSMVLQSSENIEESIENYNEIELSSENCEYSINSETNSVSIDEYEGNMDCVVIPNEIDGKKIETINTDKFSECYNLETIKISKEVSSQIQEIPDFEINEELEEENYVVYTTTREYGEAYKGYLELSEEEKAEVNIIPPKYEKPLERVSQNEVTNLQPVGSVESVANYDLRSDIDIKVENQNPYGICYAYSSFTAAETYWTLNKNESVDFSEVHAAILTTGNGGQTFLSTTDYYASKLGPVYEEEYPIYDVRGATLSNATSIDACINSTSPSSYSSIQNAAKTEIPVKYVTQTIQFPTITQSIKQNSTYDDDVEDVRKDIKTHIKTYGALAAVVNSNSIVEYNGKMVENDQSTSAVNHAVTIIGWDDNFDISNFPSSSRPTENGAYLVLNSWGKDWGENGCYWVSYEDKWIEYYLIGVTEMTEASENLQASTIVVTDQETGDALDNGYIEDGTKIKIEVEATVTTPISGESIEVSLRDNTTDYTSYMTVSGTELVNNKADIEILVDTEELKGDQYVLEINYGTETVSKMIETPKDFSYSVNSDGTISIIAYSGDDKEIVIPAEYDGYKVSAIAKDAFIASGVEKVTIEEGITKIGQYAFRGCEQLKEIEIPRTVTTIELAAFIGCSSLEQLIIPRSVTTLGAGLVQQCTSLKEIVIFKETTSIGNSMIYNTPNAVIYCEADSTALSYAKNKSYSYSIITESYNITYNNNAGTDTVTNMPTTQNKVKYDTITMSNNIPVRSGHEFLGWATSSAATEVEYLPGDYYRTDANLNLYAVWEATEKEISYTIEYYKDGVKADEETVSKKVEISATTIAVGKAGINTSNKYLGYTFEKTEPAVIPDTASDGDIIKVYYNLETYNITYELNGGSLEDGKKNPETYTVNDTFTLNNPVKEGYTFIGWTGSNGNTPNTSVTIKETTGDKNYIANFAINSYKVTYKVDGNVYGEIENYNYGETITPREEPTKTGYKFSGWSEIPETMPANDVEVTGTFTIDETQTKELSYTVEYYKDNVKQESDTETEKITVHVLEADTIPVDKTKINTKDKYTGYKLEKTEPVEIPDSVNNGEIIKIYYILENYNITYDLDGGNLEVNNPETYTINDSFTLNNPEKEGYTFIGWTGSNGEEPETTITIEKGTTGEKNYKANFTINTYTVTYKVDGDVYGEVENYDYGEKITPREEPTKTGYKFSGWSEIPETMPSNNVEVIGTFTIDETQAKELSYTVEYYKDNVKQDNDTETEKIAVQILEADTLTVDKSKINTTNKYVGYKFEKTEPTVIPDTVNTGDVIKVYYTSEIYTITYDLASGTLENEKTNPETYTVNDTFTLNNPEKAGYTFIGWTGSNGEEPETTITIEKGTTGDKNYKANFTINTYTITYDLDGGNLEDGKENPAKFTVNDAFVLENPEKEGYTFIGWTGSNGEEPQKTITIAKGTTGDKNYKANFTINTYTVTYKVDGEVYGEVESYNYGETITPREEPTKTGYKFSGWGEIPETMPAKNLEFSGIFYVDGTQIKELNYTVEYYKDNVKQEADTETEKKVVQVLEADTLTVDKTKINTTNKYVGYKFEKTEPAVIPDTVNTDDVIKIYYTSEIYKVTYNLDGGSLEEGKENPAEFTVNDAFVLENPEKEGYTFIGWTGSNGDEPEKTVTIAKGTTESKEYTANYSINSYKLTIKYIFDNGAKYPRIYEGDFVYGENYSIQSPTIDGYTNDLETVEGTMGAENKIIEVHYTPNVDTRYTVEHYKQNLLDDNYTLFDIENVTGTTDTETSAISKGYEGFTAQEFEQENIDGDESTIVKIYYDRNKYTITYFAKASETDAYTYIDSQEYKYEEQITPIEYPESYGKKFGGWSEIPETMPANDVDIYGEFSIDESQTKELSYTVEYYKNGVKQDADTQTERSIVQVLEPDEIIVDKSKINTTDKYVGYEFYNTNPETIPEKVNNGDVIKIYYLPIIYTITYDLDGGYYSSENNVEFYTIEENVTLNNPEKEGYTFIGWTGSNGEEPEKTVTIEKGTIGDKHYKANYSINSYKLTYKIDGEQYGEVETYEYGQAITPREEPTKRGYIFSGWSEIPETMPSNDVEVTGTFTIDESQTKELSYTVEYYKNNVKQESDTEIEKVVVLEFKPDEITVNKEKINIQDRYAGYTFEKTEPAQIPETLTNGDVIKVYYTANIDTKYTVEHYKQNILDDDYTLFETEETTGTTDTETSVISKEYEGFTAQEVDQENIEGTGDTVVKVYYDRNKFTLTYKVDGEIDGDVETYKYEEPITPRENPVKLGYKFSGWSEIPEIMPANNIEASGTFTFDETQTKELSYTVEYYKDNVKQDADTEPEKITVHVLDSDEMIVNKEKINVTDKYQGCILDSTLTSIPDTVTSGDIIKVYYVRKEAKVNVEYRDFVSGEEISEKVVKTAKVFDTYDISGDKKEIDGYTFIEGPEELTGEYTEEEQTKVYKYAKNFKVTVNYIEKASGEVISEPVVIDGYETKDYETEEKTIENYILIETPENKTGKMTKEEIIVNYYYIRISEGVIERHIDITTNEVLGTEVYQGNEGDSYKTEPKTFEGYTLVEDRLPNNAEGTMADEAIIVEYFYIRNASVKVQYVDKISNEILLEETIDGFENDDYETEEKEIEGYSLVEKPANAEGTMTVIRDENNNAVTETIVIYYYKKISEGVIERHYDIKNNELLDEAIHSGLEGDTYKVEPKEFEGYDIVEEKMPTNTEGTMTKEKIEINYYYIRKTTVRVEYIDVTTNEKIVEDVIINNHEGDQYKAERKELEQYIMLEDRLPENEEGTTVVTKDENGNVTTETVVKYYYVRKATVKVEYINKETGEKIAEDTVIEGHEGKAYKVEPKEIEGYNLLEENENTEGTMTKEEIVAKFYYEKIVTSEEYLINEDDIKKITMGTTIDDLKDNMSIKGNYTIVDIEGKEVSEDEVIKTGMKLKLEDGKEYDLIVRGDLNCDGRVSLTDLSKLILHYNEMRGFILTGSPCKAADMNYDGRVSLIDVSQMVVFYNSI